VGGGRLLCLGGGEGRATRSSINSKTGGEVCRAGINEPKNGGKEGRNAGLRFKNNAVKKVWCGNGESN